MTLGCLTYSRHAACSLASACGASKRGGKLRRLGVPALRDRVVQAALKTVLEPIFEADFKPCSAG